ncbi:Uncharacterised protein [Neisseria meningitidis]|nr:Uncharacterised protein [Neisseria meningitidis]CWO67898.1 Uncharacterised protein [Neisseria meningitidis]CWP98601.1 Uncharacterised protein [Neisseria meningitidis]CWQ10451.1 Uncharacterised protein [Neisseria meningitidis]CWQ71409.1 Uncharacterised protein [Neisseria meningitidis]
MAAAPDGPVKPAAGVMPTRPETAPEASPKAEGLCPAIFSQASQPAAPNTADTCVTAIAIPAAASAASADPALKPNQPNHNIAAPISVIAILCGGIASRP